MNIKDQKFNDIWNQERIPVVFLVSKSQPLKIRLPYSPYNAVWLKDKHRIYPTWLEDDKCWQVPKSWIDDVTKRALKKYRKVYVIHSYRSIQKCAPVCWNATGIICVCSCGGVNHGAGQPEGKWYIVSGTYAFKWGNIQYSCRLILPMKK